jgi:hypothetical protein
MVMVGTLIAESLRVGAVLDDVALAATKISRADVGDVDAGQPNGRSAGVPEAQLDWPV